MRALVVIITCLFTTAAWAADRELTLKEGEKRSFKLPGVAQIAIDDASVVEGAAKDSNLTIGARRAGNARILVLLKNDQWVTFKVKVVAGDTREGPVPEALPNEGEPLHLRVGESRAFETPGISRMPMGAQNFEAKVTGKLVELRGVAAGRSTLDLWLAGGKRLTLPVVVEGEKGAPKPAGVMSATIDVEQSGEVLVKAPDVEAVQVEDDEVAEVRIVGEGRVVVRGLSGGETVVNIRRAGKVYSHPVNVTGSYADE